ncbi:hypothetical protein, partial [Dyella silvatica]|uniref:hypothetical protein n=1 Tax=Dyella silvatica TaxID=2992128 RepID=UPI00224D8F08
MQRMMHAGTNTRQRYGSAKCRRRLDRTGMIRRTGCARPRRDDLEVALSRDGKCCGIRMHKA